MTLPKVRSLSYLSVAGVVLLVGGLGVAIFASQQNTENRSRAATETVTVTDSRADFSGTQGQKGWYYGYSNGAYTGVNSFVEFPNFNGGWYLSNSYWVGASVNTMHPNSPVTRVRSGALLLAIKRWVSTVDGEITINGKFADADPITDTNITDGVVGYMYVDGVQKKSWVINNQNTTGLPIDEKFTVQKGTKIDFIVAPMANDYNDTTEFWVTITQAGSSGTKVNFDLLLHGIGKSGDSQTSDWSGSNQTPKTNQRPVSIEVYEQTTSPRLVNTTGNVTFDAASGSFKGTIDLGPGLSNRSYVIKAKLTQSLWGTITKDIQAGTTNALGQMTLKNGDVNNDGYLNNVDTQLIRKCHVDEDPEFNSNGQGANCTADEKKKADIDDDGNVNRFDLSLIFRELSNQQ